MKILLNVLFKIKMYDKSKPLNDILFRINRIQTKIENISFEEFKNNLDIKDIIKLNLIEIGEACKNLISKFNFDDSIFKKTKAMRNLITHNYWINRDMEIWDVSNNELNELKEKVLFELK